MTGRYSFAREPRWVVGHLVVLALMATMIGLGYWQLTVSEDKGFSLQNFGYALQWWAFTVFGLLMWLRILRDHARHPEPSVEVRGGGTSRGGAAGESLETTPVDEPAEPTHSYRRYVPPSASDIKAEDPAQAAYNAYLAQLDRKGKS